MNLNKSGRLVVTISIDGKVLRGSYTPDTPASTTESHQSIQLVSVYDVERGLILPVQQVNYRDYGFVNMAQAQRKAGQGLNLLKSLFRMK